MPAFVIAPAYVAPPPNNVIFANIHNTTVINNVINNPASSNGIAGSGAAAASLPPAAAQKANLIQPQQRPGLTAPSNAPVQSSLPSAGPAQTSVTGALSAPTPQNPAGKALPGLNGQALAKPNIATAPTTNPLPPSGAKPPAHQPVAKPKMATAPAGQPGAVNDTSKITPALVAPATKPPANTVNVAPKKPLPPAQPPKPTPPPAVAGVTPPSPKATTPQAQPRLQQQAQRIQPPRLPSRPPVPAKSGCKPGQNCR
jgi:hypothetical protein